MPVKDEFILNLKGKSFVLFAGLLDLGHQSGLIAIENEVMTDLSQPEKDCWVVRSTGRFRSADGEAIWSAHGDASPGNSQMRGAYLRHAETRAAARMLRIATNVGMTAFEELGEMTDERETGTTRPAANGKPTSGADSAVQRAADASRRGQAMRAGGQDGGMVANQSADAPRCSQEGCDTEISPAEANASAQRGWPPHCKSCGYKRNMRERAERTAAAA